ncbi:MAG: hypothetical protein HY744_15120 [Deltaproteobacteria bacterium]|nr:hypothetical protein [Deltaproteobacteria bacterium]
MIGTSLRAAAALAAAVLVLLTGGAARADATLTLPASGVVLQLPGSPGDWRAHAEGGADRVERTSPPRPAISLQFQESQGQDFIYRTRAPLISFKLLPRSEASCDDMLSGLSTGGRPARSAVSPERTESKREREGTGWKVATTLARQVPSEDRYVS